MNPLFLFQIKIKKKSSTRMKFSITITIVVFTTMSLWIHGFLIPFSPTSPMELHPGSIVLCGNCQESYICKNQMFCRLFGKTDPLRGHVYFHSCSVVRNDTSLCGPQGRYYHRRLA